VTHLLFSGEIDLELFTKARELGIHIVDEYFLSYLIDQTHSLLDTISEELD